MDLPARFLNHVCGRTRGLVGIILDIFVALITSKWNSTVR
jgi:hypothetical protein